PLVDMWVYCNGYCSGSRPRVRSTPGFDSGPGLAIDFGALYRFALFVLLLPLGESDGPFHSAVLEVHAHRDEGHAALDGLANQLLNLVAVEQQLSPAQRLVVRVPAVGVRADVDVVQKHFPIVDPREAVAEVDAAFANRLDLGAEQRNARLERLEKVVVVMRFAVLGDVGLSQLAFGFLFHADRANRAASFTAAIILRGSATPFPAMSNAV